MRTRRGGLKDILDKIIFRYLCQIIKSSYIKATPGCQKSSPSYKFNSVNLTPKNYLWKPSGTTLNLTTNMDVVVVPLTTNCGFNH